MNQKLKRRIDHIRTNKTAPPMRDRPRKPIEELKKTHSVRLTDETWEDLSIIGGGNRAAAIEELISDHFNRLRSE